MRIQVLGPVCLWRADDLISPAAGQRAVLALLAMAGGQPMSRAELIDALWAQRPPARATNVIQTHIKHLRRLMEPDRRPRTASVFLPSVGDGYALRVSPEMVDLFRVRALLGDALARQRAGDPHQAAALLGDALRLWPGAPLADVPNLAEHPKVVALVRERHAALLRYGECLIAAGSAAEAVPVLEEAVAAQPLDEAGQARLIAAYQAAGRRAQAFAAYHKTRHLLADELGVDPGPELLAAHAALLHAEEAVPLTIIKPVTVATAPAQLPSDVRGFTGRTAQLARLDQVLATQHDESGAAMLAIVCGTPGVGKTALAVRWAHRVRDQFPDGQIYLNLRGYDPEQPMRPDDALARILRSLDLPSRSIPFDLEECAALYRSLLDGRRMLVVLDNAASVAQVQPLLPGTASCAVLVTSRHSLPGLVARHGAARIDLDLLPADDAVTLLRQLIGDRVRAEPPAAIRLAEQCVRLPLALRVVAELALNRPATSLVRLADELADQRRRLDLLDASGDPDTGVQAVFSWSYRQLAPAAASAFRLLGSHSGADLNRFAVAALTGTDIDTAGHLLDLLMRAHLVQVTDTGRYGMHDLLRAYAERLAADTDSEAELHAALGRLLDHYLGTVITAIDILHPAKLPRRSEPTGPATAQQPALADPVAALAWLDAERANLVATAVYAAHHGWPEYTIRLAMTLFKYLEGGGHYREATVTHAHALGAVQRTDDAASQAHILTDLAVVLAQQGQHRPAIEHLGQAADICARIGDAVGQARASVNLGFVYRRQGLDRLAVTQLQQAIAICEPLGALLGQARAAGNLGCVYQRQGAHRLAAEYLHQSIALCRQLGDPVGEAYALTSLGDMYGRLGSYEQAIAHHRRALTVFRHTVERVGEATALNGMGNAHLRSGDHEAALADLERALVLFRELGEPAGVARALNGIGAVWHRLDQPGRAHRHHGEALAIAGRIGDWYELARAHMGLARTHPDGPACAAANEHRAQASAYYPDLQSTEIAESDPAVN